MEPVRSIKAVLEDPRYQAAPAEVKAFYWGAIGLLWEGAERAGKGPRLKRSLLRGAAELVDWGLALELEGEVEIGWVTEVWRRAQAGIEQRRAANQSRWSKPAKNADRKMRPACDPHNAVRKQKCGPHNPLEITEVFSDPGGCEISTTFALLQERREELILKPEEEEKGKRTRTRHAYSPGFERFWKAYPVHREKPEAFAMWGKLGCEAFVDLVVSKVEELKREDDSWHRGFVKWPARWLKGGGWDDDPIPPKPSAADVAIAEYDRRMAEYRVLR